ncbi:MAG: twin-arginine translocase subunit TatC [Planctomycetes bacterium]|nr:twin-arginine translocase subunit TatC [Planctomycetota bacterium]
MDDKVEEVEMSFGDHLDELRRRLIRAILATLLAFIIVFNWHVPVLRFVVAPFSEVARDLRLDANHLFTRSPADSFFAYMKVSLIVALLCAAPVWMWQFWAFVGAGLYDHEKKAVYRFVPPMFILFFGGVAFGYTMLIPIGLRYLLSFADPGVLQNWIGLSEYLSLFTTLTLVLGVVFELPIAMALMAKIGLVRARTFREKRRYFILGAFILGAILTPPDAVTQVLMATPICLLFELGIGFAWLLEPEREAVDWKRWRRRGLVLVGIAAILVYFQGELVDAYRGRLVTQRMRHAVDEEESNEGFPYFSLLDQLRSIDFKAKALFQIIPGDEEELVVVGDGKKAALLRFSYSDRRIQPMGAEGRATHFLVSNASHSVTVELVDELPGLDFMGLLVLAIEQASEDDLPELSAMAAALVGSNPPGVRSLLEDDDASAHGAIKTAWRGWWQGVMSTWVYRAGAGR